MGVPIIRPLLLILIFWPFVCIWKIYDPQPKAKSSLHAVHHAPPQLLPKDNPVVNQKRIPTNPEDLIAQSLASSKKDQTNYDTNGDFLKHVSSHESSKQRLNLEPSNSINIHSTREKIDEINNCNGRRIFMYDLPTQFNIGLLHQCNRTITSWLNFCPHIQNNGFGQVINARSGWYGTDFYMLEVIFHARMRNYPCLTRREEEANAFFIPYYSGLDALRFLYGRNRPHRHKHGVELIKWLEEKGGSWWKKWGGQDHFMIMGRTAWDFASEITQENPPWGTSLREQRALANVTAFFIESRPGRPNEQAVPYPTSFHPPSMEALKAWLEEVRASSRPHLFTFIGAPRRGTTANVRQAVLDECLSSPTLCGLLDCKKIKCAHNPEPIKEKLLSSQFCLQPPGDSPTRRSTFDGMIAGCIPVFFHNDSAYSQYTWHLPPQHSQYSVFIPFEDLQRGNVRVQDVLLSYSAAQIAEMRDNIISLIPKIIYLSPSAAMAMTKLGVRDAFDLSLEAMLGRISQLKSASEII